MDIWVGTSNWLFSRGSRTGTNFPKKLFSYWQNSTLCDTSILLSPFVLTLASDRAVLNGNGAISILVASTKKRYPSSLKKVFVLQKISFKVKVLKTFETFTDSHIKTCRSLKRRAILKIFSSVFRRTYALSVGFKMKTLRKCVFQCQEKTNSSFAVKVTKEATIHFYYLFDEHVFQTSER